MALKISEVNTNRLKMTHVGFIRVFRVHSRLAFMGDRVPLLPLGIGESHKKAGLVCPAPSALMMRLHH
jgi:hypothetical protein